MRACPTRDCASARLARSIGIAKPTPALALVPVTLGSAICALIAIDVTVAVDQRAARVAVVDRGVGLDRAGDELVVALGRRQDQAALGRDDARRDGLGVAERVADRDDRVADLDARDRAELERMQLARGHVDLDHGEVVERVAAEHRGLGADAVLERDDAPSVAPSTTCAFVRMRPSLSITKPEPCGGLLLRLRRARTG